MTDENQKLTPARPVAPRCKLPANPRMAQPMRRPPERVDAVEDPVVEAPVIEPAVVERPIVAPVAERAVVEPAADEPPAKAVVEPVIASAPETNEVAPPAQSFRAVQTVVAFAEPEPAPQRASAAVEARPKAGEPGQPQFDFPKTIRDTLRRVDDAWSAFRAAALRFPSERMDERLGEDAWTRKQMLEHVAAWHDLTADRLIQMINTGASAPLDRDTDAFNASVARRAVGKTSGEVLKDIDATFNRLRRQMARLSDAQLKNDHWWAAYVIGGNTYGHYEEHWADIYSPEPAPDARSRRR